jgi:threonine/homoserine/homoserine lactone efflux protein
MAIGSALAFWATSALLVLVPGADWAYVLAAGRALVPAVAGLLIGYLALTAVVAAGVAALVTGHPAALTVLTVLGAGYLIWLGLTAVARPPAPAAGEPVAGHVLLRGVGVSGLNPKGLLLFLALLPQFTDPRGAWPAAAQIGLLGVLHTLNCGAGYLAVGLLARALLRARPAATRLVTRVSGVSMIALGVALAAERWLA